MSELRKLWNVYRLRRNVWLKPEQLLKMQQRRLKAIVNHAFENVEYYHILFNSLGLKPDDIKNVGDLQKIPILTKETVRQNFPAKITARNINLDKCQSYSTSGSTGIPLTVLVDPRGGEYRAALFGRAFFEGGLRLRDKMMMVGDARHFPKRQQWFQRLGVLRRRYFPAAEPVENQLSRIVGYNPDAIFGYSSFLYLLAMEVQKREVKLSPRIVFSTAEVLGEKERKFIESILETEIFDLYGCVELERLAWECEEHVGYHMDVDSSIIEFVKDDEAVSPGEEGKLVVTCLYNYAMPMIRYEIGDIGIPSKEKCPCGRGFPLAEKILGRKDDFIISSSGRMIFSPLFIHFMRYISGIAQYKFVQESLTELRIFIVKDENFSDRTINQVTTEVRKLVGEKMAIVPEIVNHIEKERSGKLRTFVSHVKQPDA